MLGSTSIALLTFAAAFAAPPTTVRVAFVEALAPRDTTSSERFQKEYEAAISAGRRALEKRLHACGYKLETETAFYDASDPLQAKERGTELAHKGAWLIVGPRRSNHYILLAQGAAQTPTLSLMASEVESLGSKHLSLEPSTLTRARAATEEVGARLTKTWGTTYISVVSKDCASCVAFSSFFKLYAKSRGIREAGHFEVAGEAPDTSAIEAAVKAQRPAFIVLPNYSKLSTHVMTRLATYNEGLFYVGDDGWGDSNFGFVHKASGNSSAKGFSVRGFPPMDRGLSQIRLGLDVTNELQAIPKGGTSLGILKSLDGFAELLCQSRARTRESFSATFGSRGRGVFGAPWGTSIYNLAGGNLTYSHSNTKGSGHDK